MKVLHWNLDVGISKVQYRICLDEAGKSSATFRHKTLNLLNTVKVFKAGIKANKNEQVEIMVACRKSLQNRGIRKLARHLIYIINLKHFKSTSSYPVTSW